MQSYPRIRPPTNPDDYFYSSEPRVTIEESNKIAHSSTEQQETLDKPRRSFEEVTRLFARAQEMPFNYTTEDYGEPAKMWFGVETDEQVESLGNWSKIDYDNYATVVEEEGPSAGIEAAGKTLIRSRGQKEKFSVLQASFEEIEELENSSTKLPDVDYAQLRKAANKDFDKFESQIQWVLDNVKHEFDLKNMGNIMKENWQLVKDDITADLDEQLDSLVEGMKWASFQSQQWKVDEDGAIIDQCRSIGYVEKYFPEAIDRALVELEYNWLQYRYRPEKRVLRFTPDEIILAIHHHAILERTHEQEAEAQKEELMSLQMDDNKRRLIALTASVAKLHEVTRKMANEVSALKTKLEMMKMMEEDMADEDGDEKQASKKRGDEIEWTDEEWWEFWGYYGLSPEKIQHLVDNPREYWQLEKKKLDSKKAEADSGRKVFDRGISYMEHLEYRWLSMQNMTEEEQKLVMEENGKVVVSS